MTTATRVVRASRLEAAILIGGLAAAIAAGVHAYRVDGAYGELVMTIRS